jgi:biotin carboxyl carrier protein
MIKVDHSCTIGAAERAMIDNARALLDMALRGDWQDIDVRIAGGEIRLRRSAFLPAAQERALPSGANTGLEITAPHVATLLSVASRGETVRAGEPVAVITVLDIESELIAPINATVITVAAEPGDLVEFGQILIQLSP